jgi:CheY-like chemotaxis protein
MPGMTRYELAHAVLAEWPGLPIIIATGYAELPDARAGFYQGSHSRSFRKSLVNAIAAIKNFPTN